MFSGVLATLHWQAALLVRASLPFVGIGVHLLVPLRSNTGAVFVSVANEVIAENRLAALLEGAAQQGAIVLFWLPLGGRVANFWKAN